MRTTNEQTGIVSHQPRYDISGDISSKLSLRANDVVRCRVVRVVPPNHALLSIKGEEVMAETKVCLTEGDLVDLQVRQVGPRLVLEAAKPIGHNLPSIHSVNRFDLQGFPYRFLLDLVGPLLGGRTEPGHGELTAEIGAIRGVLQEIALLPGKEETPRALASALQNSGIFWEGRLKALLSATRGSSSRGWILLEHDVKGLALAALSKCSDAETSAGGLLRGFLEGLEQLQLLNVSAMEDRGKCLFVLPVRFNDEYRFVQLLIDVRKGSRQRRDPRLKEASCRVRLLLDMSVLGPVHVEVAMFDKALRIEFLVDNEEVRELFSVSAADMTGIFVQHGFTVQEVICRSSNRDEVIPATLVDEILDPERHQISLVV